MLSDLLHFVKNSAHRINIEPSNNDLVKIVSLLRSHLCRYLHETEAHNACGMFFVTIDITFRRSSSVRMNYSKNFPARERENATVLAPSFAGVVSSRFNFQCLRVVSYQRYDRRFYLQWMSCYAVVPAREKRYLSLQLRIVYTIARTIARTIALASRHGWRSLSLASDASYSSSRLISDDPLH